MRKTELQTPAILVDLDILDQNIRKYQDLCNKYNKQLWPMIKTHKSSEIINMQVEAGATGFLCGTLDECEKLAEMGIQNIMYAYPVASEVNIKRVLALSQKCNFIIRLDNLQGAQMLDAEAEKAGTKVNYTIIVDSGLHRFGILPDQVLSFADSLKALNNLAFKGISTHPGHVYSATTHQEIQQYVNDEKNSVKIAVEALKNAGYNLEIISSGSTPTFAEAVKDEYINIYHPGNYVFHDNIQMSTDVAKESECALSVLATVISNPASDRLVCDAGAKTLGLDQGAHGNSAIKGFGYIKGHPELTIYSLSEEVGKIHIDGATNIKVGDIIEIIPNHSCSTANLTSYLIGCKGDLVEKVIHIDMRGNSTRKNA